MSDKAGLRLGAILLFVCGGGFGAWGISIVKSESYSETSRGAGRERRTTTTTGPEAVRWGWTLIAGATSALAWAAVLAWPPVNGGNLAHLALVVLSLAGIVAVTLLQMPPESFRTNPRAFSFYLCWALYPLGALAILLFRDAGLIGLALAWLVLAAGCVYQWGLPGMQGAMVSVATLLLIGLHVAAGILLGKLRKEHDAS